MKMMYFECICCDTVIAVSSEITELETFKCPVCLEENCGLKDEYMESINKDAFISAAEIQEQSSGCPNGCDGITEACSDCPGTKDVCTDEDSLIDDITDNIGSMSVYQCELKINQIEVLHRLEQYLQEKARTAQIELQNDRLELDIDSLEYWDKKTRREGN